MNRHSSGAVELRDLTDARELEGLTELHLVSGRSPVRDVALVADFEEIGSVGPDTVVLLAPDGARGGWMISAALRSAWERRACAVIVPEQPFTASVVDLAKRLEVSLFTTRREMTRLALDVAIRIGTSRAESTVRVRAAVDRLATAPDPAAAIALVSDELGGASVWVESAGARTYASPTSAAEGGVPPGDRAPTSTVRVTLSPRDGTGGALLALVPPPLERFAEQLLASAAPSLRALLLEQQLSATRASLPVLTITALTGSAPGGSLDEPQLSGVEASPGLPLDDAYLAVCLLSEEPDLVGALVHQLWSLAFPDAPLARFDGGWIGFLPAADRGRLAADLERIERGFTRTAGLPLSGGASRVRRSREAVGGAVREAWLAARLADPRTDAFIRFDRAPVRLLGRLVPPDLAEQLVAALFPELLADAASDDVIDAVLATLSARGSISLAARRLGVHRNTVQARLRRAEELGVDLSDPDAVLPAHLLLTAVRRATLSRRDSARPRR